LARRWIATGVAAIAASLAGPAHADATSYTFSTATALPLSAVTRVSASCPEGQSTLSGGFRLQGTGSQYVDPYVSIPRDSSFTAAFSRISSPGDPTGEAVVVCTGRPGVIDQLVRRSQVVDTPLNTPTTGVARCPRHARVIGGGVGNDFQYPGKAYVARTQPLDGGDRDRLPDDGWKGTMVRYDTTGPSTEFKVVALCIRESNYADGLKYRSREEFPTEEAFEVAVAPCPDGTSTVGGGGGIRPESNSRFGASVPWDLDGEGDFTPDNGWAAGITSFTPRQNPVVTSYAICHS
jgi:hypothetical protein